MSRFKGTPGKWEIESGIHNGVIIISSKTSYICDVDADFEEGEYNALLISKAPEMLEMLERCSEYISVSGADGIDRIEILDDIKQIIKEATEI